MQKGKKFLWQYLPFYILVILLSLAAISWYATGAIKRLYLNRTASDLEARSRLVGKIVDDNISQEDLASIQSMCQALGRELATRFTVVLPSGQVLGDSDEDPKSMDNHGDRPEIMQAFAGSVGMSTRFSNTLKKDMMYVAIPLHANGEVTAVIRSSLSVADLKKTLSALYRRVTLAGFIVAAGAALISVALSRRIKKPVEELKEGAKRFGRGDLNHRVHISDPEEFMLLGNAMNSMASQLSERIHTITSQRKELEVILSSMIEAVLVIDKEENILRFNHAAGRLFDVEPKQAQNKSIQEVVRNIHLLRFIRETLSTKRTSEREIILHEEGERFLQAHGTILLDHKKQVIGVLVVLNDITRLKQLENIRKDFVANVSHELKTPVTAIKGSVETLKDGAIKDDQDTQQFLDIIKKHTDRLNAIIEDLLDLSRIEQETEKRQIVFEKGNIRNVLEEAIAVCQSNAADKRIKIELECNPEIKAQINPPILEEAIVNLIDNAIKYSKIKSSIRIEGTSENDTIIIRVQDWGCGIPPEHHSRIFERFYRVDKARSRNLGGTGLGLAIVKHIVQAHEGRVDVESTPGQGSVFIVTLPKSTLKSSENG